MEDEKKQTGTVPPSEPAQVTMTAEELDIFKNNLSKSSYENGKVAGFEMKLKEAKKSISEKYGIETEGIKDFETLIEKTLQTKIEKEKTEVITKKQSEVEKIAADFETAKKEKEILQNKILEIQKDYESKIQESENRFIQMNIENLLNEDIAKVPFDVPKYISDLGDDEVAKYLQTERMKLKTLSKSFYQYEISENALILKRDNEIVKDKMLNPVKHSDIIIDFAKKNYFNLKSEKTVSQVEGQKYGNSMANVKTKEQFDTLMQSKGIVRNSNEYLAYYAEFRKNNK